MAKKRARSKSTPPAKAQRPTAPSFDLAPPPALDSFAPVSSPIVAEASVDPMGETAVSSLQVAPAPERLTVPEWRASDRAVPVAASAAPHDEDHAADAFFASAEAAVAREAAAEREAARVAALEEAAAALPPPPAPEVLARRRVLRRAVSAVVGVAAVFAVLAGVSVTARASKGDVNAAVFVHAPVTTFLAAPTPVVEPTPVAQPAAVAEPVAEPAVAPVVAADPAPAVAPAADSVPAAKPAPAAEPNVEKTIDPAGAKALTKQALGLLERGAFAKAIDAAQASIEADPSDASPYLYWGTALMETGKRADAKQVFAKCVASATRGPKHECAQFK